MDLFSYNAFIKRRRNIMTKNNSIAEELKALAAEMANAFRLAKSSPEFKNLEKEISTSVKNVSSSLIKSLKAANQSQEAGKIKKRVGRVVKLGKEKGKAKAELAAKQGLKNFNKAMKKLSTKLRPQ